MTDTIHATPSPAAATAGGIHPFGPGEKGPPLARFYVALWRFERRGLSTPEPTMARDDADRRRELDEAEAAARAAGADDADIEDIRTEIGDALLDATWT